MIRNEYHLFFMSIVTLKTHPKMSFESLPNYVKTVTSIN
jgi:hypothetical protein